MDEQRKSEEQRQQAADELLAEYLRRVEAGEPVDREEFLRLHPDSADLLRGYFDAAESMNRRIAQPGSPATGNVPPTSAATGPSSRGDETIAPRAQANLGAIPAGPFAVLPRQFGRYHVEKLLGTGAMGAVYLA